MPWGIGSRDGQPLGHRYFSNIERGKQATRGAAMSHPCGPPQRRRLCRGGRAAIMRQRSPRWRDTRARERAGSACRQPRFSPLKMHALASSRKISELVCPNRRQSTPRAANRGRNSSTASGRLAAMIRISEAESPTSRASSAVMRSRSASAPQRRRSSRHACLSRANHPPSCTEWTANMKYLDSLK